MVEYKVRRSATALLSGKFDPEALETALNNSAAEGWRVVQGFVAASLWKSLKAEIVVILERPTS